MRRRVWLALIAAALCHSNGRAAPAPRRIVSLIPSVTEMIFAMGDGNRVVGVSNYDHFPPEVERVTRVGGLLDPDDERILSLRPDLVVVYSTQVELKQRLDRAHVPYYSYEHRGLADIMQTMRAIGARIGAPDHGERLAAATERGLGDVRRSVAGLPRPRTLVVLEHEPSTLRNVRASGGYGFLHDVLELAGGDDVFADIRKQSVEASAELILARKPDVIIDLRYGSQPRPVDEARERALWNPLASVPAVRLGQVHVLDGNEFVSPGPRVVEAARRIARAIHGGAMR
jgi:iron complex transport system substrate-binding protein